MDPVVDAESGLIYLRARYYDPATGQFLSRDPLVALTGEAYGYAGDNPLNAADPTGLWRLPITNWCIGTCTPPGITMKDGLALVNGPPSSCSSSGGVLGSLNRFITSIAFAVSAVPPAGPASLDELSASAAQLDPADAGGQLTRAGRAYAKAPEVFGPTSGGPAAINEAGQNALDEILTNPGTTRSAVQGGNFNGGLRFVSPDGTGAVFGPDGTLQYFGKMSP